MKGTTASRKGDTGRSWHKVTKELFKSSSKINFFKKAKCLLLYNI